MSPKGDKGKQPAREPVVLHLQHASMQWSDAPTKVRQDLGTILGRSADAVTFTEVAEHRAQLRAIAHEHGYWLLGPDRGEGAIAVRTDHTVGMADTIPVNPAGPQGHGHGPRFITWVHFIIEGEPVYVHVAHWLTHAADPSGRAHVVMSEAMAAAVRNRAAGPRVAFWAGDLNMDDRPRRGPRADRVLVAAGLTSVWDELGEWPDTFGHRTIDVIGSYDPDHRVKAIRSRVWRQLNADHHQISAWYEIRPRTRRKG